MPDDTATTPAPAARYVVVHNTHNITINQHVSVDSPDRAMEAILEEERTRVPQTIDHFLGIARAPDFAVEANIERIMNAAGGGQAADDARYTVAHVDPDTTNRFSHGAVVVNTMERVTE